jgi:hypothetical protein
MTGTPTAAVAKRSARFDAVPAIYRGPAEVRADFDGREPYSRPVALRIKAMERVR